MNDSTSDLPEPKSLTDLKLEARARGDRFYNTGTLCRRGHNANRYASNGMCTECLTPGTRAKNRVLARMSAVVGITDEHTLRVVVPTGTPEADRDQLDFYMVRCMHSFAKQKGWALMVTYYQRRITWVESTGKPLKDYSW